MIKIYIILVSWNAKKHTMNCIRSLKGLQVTSKQNVHIVLVDNDSIDDTEETVKKFFPDVFILPQKNNTGFAEGNNIGIRFALSEGADYVWIINNDTYADPSALQELLSVSENNRDCIYGTKIYFQKGCEYHLQKYDPKDLGNVIWYAGGIIDWSNMYCSHRGVDEVDYGQYDKETETDFITGCSFFMHRNICNRCGFFDKKYFMYLEDVEYCVKATKKGFSIKFVPQARIWHVNAGSTSGPGNALHDYYLTRNRLYLGLKYAPFRTKIALIREAVKQFFLGSKVKKRAIFDAMTFRFGGRYSWKIQQY